MHEYFCLKKSNCAKDTTKNPLKDQVEKNWDPEFDYKQQKYPGQPTCYFYKKMIERKGKGKETYENENKPITNLLNSKASNQPLRRLLRFRPMDFQYEGAAHTYTPPTRIC